VERNSLIVYSSIETLAETTRNGKIMVVVLTEPDSCWYWYTHHDSCLCCMRFANISFISSCEMRDSVMSS